jgi:hypothetical protein
MPLIEQQVRTISGIHGIAGCSLVEVESGMVWHSAGQMPEFDRFSEAASEFWRVHRRLSANLNALGMPEAALFSFSSGWLVLAPCCSQPSMILVAVTHKQGIDWKLWNQEVDVLKERLKKV